MKKSNDLRRVLLGLGWLAVAGIFTAALISSAKIGIGVALSTLPESAREQMDLQHPLNVEVVLGANGEPVFLSKSVQSLRDFFFHYPESGARSAAETESMNLRRFVGSIRARTVRQDADLMEVEILSGALNGGDYWVHISQLPEWREDLPTEGGG